MDILVDSTVVIAWERQQLDLNHIAARHAADVHATLRLSLERTGNSLGPHDLQIAAIALARDMAIATRDRDFSRVEGLVVYQW